MLSDELKNEILLRTKFSPPKFSLITFARVNLWPERNKKKELVSLSNKYLIRSQKLLKRKGKRIHMFQNHSSLFVRESNPVGQRQISISESCIYCQRKFIMFAFYRYDRNFFYMQTPWKFFTRFESLKAKEI